MADDDFRDKSAHPDDASPTPPATESVPGPLSLGERAPGPFAWVREVPAWWRGLHRGWRIAAGIGVVVLLGFLAGMSLFRRPTAPTFERTKAASGEGLEKPDTGAAVPVATADAPARPTLETLRGDWVIDLGERGLVRLDLETREVAAGTWQGKPVPLRASEGGALPSRWALPAEPGDTLVFFDAQGQPKETFEQVESHNADLFSFTETRSGRRRYAHRSGVLGRAALAALPMDIEDVIDLGAPLDTVEIETLWDLAESQREARDYEALLRTLDAVAQLDPDDGRLNRWRRQADRALADARADAWEDVKDRLDDLERAIERRDLRDLRKLWGGRLDSDTSRYFTQLFRQKGDIEADVRLLSVAIDGRRATDVDAQVSIGTQVRRGRPRQRESFNWQTRLASDGSFASSFP